MGKLLRHFSYEVKAGWDRVRAQKEQWLRQEDLPACLLAGWQEESPSMWRIVEEKTKPTKEEILVALCRQMKGWEKISYLLFEEER